MMPRCDTSLVARITGCSLTALVAVLATASCDRHADTADRPPEVAPAPVERVVFPAELHVEYAPVNQFIGEALATCVRGDYKAFRLLWSVRQDPLRREEFEQGWQAVRTVRVRALEKIVLPNTESASDHAGDADPPGLAPDVSFVLLMEAEFDQTHPVGRRQPSREIVLLMLREQGEWRFGRAPEPVRTWIKSRVSDVQADTTSPPNLGDEPSK